MLAAVLGILVFVGKNEKAEPFVSNSKKQPLKTAHISIDDATSIFQNIVWEGYDSIFENETLGTLQELHEKYDIKVTLYVFGEMESLAIWDFPLTYKDEFRENADWLQIGFHSGEDCDPQEDYATQQEFETDYERTESALWRLAGGDSVTSVLRLHNWYATEKMAAYLQEQGITALLCRDSEEASYSLTEEQTEELYASRDGKLEVGGLTYYVTDIRLEREEDIVATLEERKKDRMLVIFTHEWCFKENSEKLEAAVQWLVQEEYLFSDLKPVEEE
ncbi:MAG: hypothetical protein IJX66_06705 [Lachnospiraceae bacterium]|nr:hypothetical protein [Lachnospiraceae bacterium]